MPYHAAATFVIDSWDQQVYAEPAAGPKLSRATVLKTFSGDLVGSSSAELLLAQAADGGAGYVGLEHIVGDLHGRAGSFVLQHSAAQGSPQAHAGWHIVPGSGTAELRGIAGSATYQHDASGARLSLVYELPL